MFDKLGRKSRSFVRKDGLRNAAEGAGLDCPAPSKRLKFAGDHTARDHPFPSRTRKLSLAGPMVLHGRLCGRLGNRRQLFRKHKDHPEKDGLSALGRITPVPKCFNIGPQKPTLKARNLKLQATTQGQRGCRAYPESRSNLTQNAAH